MLIKKTSNKGFTLIELIIALSIFSIVIFMGYMIINGINKSTKEQAKIFNEQQAANLVNKYLTKDLELCKSISDLENDDLDKYINEYTTFYGYKIIDSQNSRVDYIVGIKDDTYDLLRVKDGVELALIEKLKVDVNNTNPFSINAEIDESITLSSDGNRQNRNLYIVNISNAGNSYEFKVNPRYTSTASGGTPGGGLIGKGHIIVHKTSTDKSVIISSSNDKDEYKQEIKVTRNNDGKTTNVSMKEYEFKIVIESYAGGIVSGLIDANTSIKNFNNINVNVSAHTFNHEGLNIVIRKEEYKEKDDDDDDDLIIEINKGNNELVKLERDESDSDLDIGLYNDEVGIEIADDGDVEVEIGEKDSSKLVTYSDDNEIEIDIGKKYINNIFGIFIETKQIKIEEVELNDKKYTEFSNINFDSNKYQKLDLDIDTINSGENESMVITRFSYKKEDNLVEQIYGDIKIERVKGKNIPNGGKKEDYLVITYPDGKKENISIGKVNGQFELEIAVSVNDSGKETQLKLLHTSKVINIRTDKQVKQIEVNGKKGNQIEEIKDKEPIRFGPFNLNAGDGTGNLNDEVIIKLKGN